MCVIPGQERAQAVLVVRAYRLLYARTLRQHRPPCAHLGRGGEDTGVHEDVEQVEVAEDWRKYGVDQTEVPAGEPWVLAQRRRDAPELGG